MIHVAGLEQHGLGTDRSAMCTIAVQHVPGRLCSCFKLMSSGSGCGIGQLPDSIVKPLGIGPTSSRAVSVAPAGHMVVGGAELTVANEPLNPDFLKAENPKP